MRSVLRRPTVKPTYKIVVKYSKAIATATKEVLNTIHETIINVYVDIPYLYHQYTLSNNIIEEYSRTNG